MVTDINVFAVRVMGRIRGEGLGAIVVAEHDRRARLKEVNFMEELPQPEGFATGLTKGNVFCLTRRVSNCLLTMRRPSKNGTAN